ncbi:MAG: hypothetical protein R3F59_22320 [Myxococcota bacterium]
MSDMRDIGRRGRTIRRADDPAPSADAAAPSGDDAPLSPFAGFGPDARTMAAGAETNRTQSLGILAIVGGVVFSTTAAIVVAVLVLLLYLGYRKVQDDKLAEAGTDKQHVRDTGIAEPVENVPVRPRSPGKGRTDRGENTVGSPNNGPPPGPVSIIVSKKMVFLSIEVNCPSGFRSRGTFRPDAKGTMKATVQNVPGDERCVATFQGSQPAKAWVTGNQTLQCTFDPIVCDRVY